MSKNTAQIRALTVTLLLEDLQSPAEQSASAAPANPPEPTPAPAPAVDKKKAAAEAAKAKAAEEAAAEEALLGSPDSEPATPPITLSGLRELAVKAVKAGKKPEVEAILAKAKTTSLTALEEKHYPAVHAALAKLGA
jgi:hypothetical protein